MENSYPSKIMHDELSMYLCNIPLEFDDFDFLQNQAKLPQIVSDQYAMPCSKTNISINNGGSEPMEISVLDTPFKYEYATSETSAFSDGTDISFPATPVTPANTPYSTPCLTPASSNPSSPGSTRKYLRASLTAKKINDSFQKIPRHKRPSHINAEHRRRSKIQNGFDDLKRIVPSLGGGGFGGENTGGGANNGTTAPKESKATMLKKAADYCRQLRSEVRELDLEATKLRDEIHVLSTEINICQQQLPDSGLLAPCVSSAVDRKKAIEDHIIDKTLMNWKYGLFSFIIRPMLESYLQKTDQAMNTTDLYTILMQWLNDDCSLAVWRPAACTALRNLCMNTSVMTSPDKLPNEVVQAIMSPMIKRDSAAMR